MAMFAPPAMSQIPSTPSPPVKKLSPRQSLAMWQFIQYARRRRCLVFSCAELRDHSDELRQGKFI